MIKAVIKTDLNEIPKTCRGCPCTKWVKDCYGDPRHYCKFGDYIEPYWNKKNPNCPLVDDEEVDNG